MGVNRTKLDDAQIKLDWLYLLPQRFWESRHTKSVQCIPHETGSTTEMCMTAFSSCIPLMSGQTSGKSLPDCLENRVGEKRNERKWHSDVNIGDGFVETPQICSRPGPDYLGRARCCRRIAVVVSVDPATGGKTFRRDIHALRTQRIPAVSADWLHFYEQLRPFRGQTG